MHFFDLDGTLIRGNCSVRFGAYLLKKGVLSPLKALSLIWFYGCYQVRVLNLEELHRACFFRLFKGQSVQEMERLAASFVDASFDRLIIKSRLELFQQAQGEKYLCSSSPEILVSLFAKKLGVDGWIATSYDADEQGRFSNLRRVVDGEQKKQFLKQQQKDGVKTVAYSDSLEDDLFLKAADEGHLLKDAP